MVEHNRGRFDAGAAAAAKAIEYARRAGDRQLEQLLLPPLVADTGMSAMPLDEYLLWLDELEAEHGSQPFSEQWRAFALGMLGRFDEARAVHAQSVATLRERGVRTVEAISAQSAWHIEMTAGDVDAAERIARRGCELLQEMGERGWLSTQACQLAESLYALGRDEDATEWVELGLELGASDDVSTQMLARQVLAKLAARGGDHARAEALAAEAVALGESIHHLIAQGDARMDFAEVLAAAGRTGDAITELERAAALYERKGATACLARAHARLGELAARAQ